MIKVNYYLLGFVCALSGFSSVVDAERVHICRNQNEIPATTPDSRFNEHADGTLTDTQTGLMWAQCIEGMSGSGCTTGSADTYTWQAALNRADSSTLASYHDWRLPNINELVSIVEEQCYDPAINLSIFPNTPTIASNFWSASPYANLSNSAWAVFFYNGMSGVYGRDSSLYVRLVRDGQ